MTERLKLILLWFLCQVVALAVALRCTWAIWTYPGEAWNILLAYDRLGNAAANDQTVETMSKRAALARNAGKRWGCVMCKFLDWFQADHCDKALEN